MKSIWFEDRTIIAYALNILALAEIIDLTIVAVAIPQIMGSLGVNIDEIALVTTAYIVSAAIFIPMTGLFVKKFGVRTVTLVSAFLFGVSSILCGLATTLEEMVIFRIVQGIGGAFLPSIAQSYITSTFTSEEQPKIMTMYSLCIVLGPIIGPVLGGSLSENLNWRYCFYVNVPICILGFAVIWAFMKKDIVQKMRIDWISFAFMAFGIGCLEYFVDMGNSNNWFQSMEMIVILATAIVLLLFFVWRGLLGSSVVNLKLFTYKNFVLSCVTMFLFMLMVVASMAYFPTMLQSSFGYPVDAAGYITAPRGVICIIVAPIVAALMQKLDPRWIMVAGLAMFSFASFMIASFAPSISTGLIIITMIVQGAGMMSVFVPIMSIAFIGLPEDMHGDASGVFNFFRNFASSIGTSLAATVISHQRQTSYNDLNGNISWSSDGFRNWSSNLGDMPELLKVALANFKLLKQAELISYLDTYYMCGVVLLLIVWIPFLLKKPKNGEVKVFTE